MGVVEVVVVTSLIRMLTISKAKVDQSPPDKLCDSNRARSISTTNIPSLTASTSNIPTASSSIPTAGRLKRPTNVPSLNLKLSGSDPNLSFHKSGISSPKSPTESGLPTRSRARKSSAGTLVDIGSKIPMKLSMNTSPPRSPGTHKRSLSPQKRFDDSRNGNLKYPQVTPSGGFKSQGSSSPNGNNNNAAVCDESVSIGSLRSQKAEELLLRLQQELLA
ncbi:uncharacterized protein [Amphiura filiformis]|uniref:uncharacterized protein isoform X2 n=1 Tax=Amphiura filiformis TaxID=82378 RepID=UPI003B20FE63